MRRTRRPRSIPVVFIASSDPVFGGFAASLAHPGGNMTGLTYYAGELNAKRLELLKAVAPGIRRVAVLASARHVAERQRRSISATSPPRPRPCNWRFGSSWPGEATISSARSTRLDEWKADALYPLPTIVFAYEAQQIADLAKWRGLPTMHWYKPFAAMGGLMAYGVDYPALQRRAARLRGQDPQRGQPGRLADRAADAVRAGRQSRDGG